MPRERGGPARRAAALAGCAHFAVTVAHICFAACLMTRQRSGSPLNSARIRWFSSFHVRCGGSGGRPGSVWHSSTTGRSAASAASHAGADLVGLLDADAVEAQRLGIVARTGTRAGPATPRTSRSPAITRCSHVTMLRSRLLSTHDDEPRIGPLAPVLGDGDELVDAVHLHRAVADARRSPAAPATRTWPRPRTAPPAPSWRGCPTATPSCRRAARGRARTSWPSSRSRR